MARTSIPDASTGSSDAVGQFARVPYAEDHWWTSHQWHLMAPGFENGNAMEPPNRRLTRHYPSAMVGEHPVE